MKRHQSLYKLSHDHHHGLVKARRLINLNSENENDFNSFAEDFLKFYKEDLVQHFREEEEILLPYFAKYVTENNELILETFKQHIKIRQTIFEIDEKIKSKGIINLNLLRQIGNLLDEHIRFEERILFPEIENHIPEKELLKIEKLIKNQL